MKNLYVIENDGRKRKASKTTCLQCGNTYLRRVAHSKRKYCSKKCAELASRKKIKVICKNCEKDFYRVISKTKRSKHGYQFCSRDCKDKAQQIGGTCPEIRPAHYGNYKKQKKSICNDCGETKLFLLIEHHKDGNRKNDELKNKEIVCMNCHAKRHLVIKNNEWTYSTYHLTPRKILKEL